MGTTSFVRSVKGFFSGRGSITDFGERYPILGAKRSDERFVVLERKNSTGVAAGHVGE